MQTFASSTPNVPRIILTGIGGPTKRVKAIIKCGVMSAVGIKYGNENRMSDKKYVVSLEMRRKMVEAEQDRRIAEGAYDEYKKNEEKHGRGHISFCLIPITWND